MCVYVEWELFVCLCRKMVVSYTFSIFHLTPLRTQNPYFFVSIRDLNSTQAGHDTALHPKSGLVSTMSLPCSVAAMSCLYHVSIPYLYITSPLGLHSFTAPYCAGCASGQRAAAHVV